MLQGIGSHRLRDQPHLLHLRAPKADIMLITTFVKVACWCANRWDYSCRVADLIRHTTKEDAKAEGEHQQQWKKI